MKQPIGDRHIAALQSLAAALDEIDLTGVLIGGAAVSLIAEPRFTRDVDALVIFDTGQLSDFLEVLERHYLVPLFPDMESFARVSRVAPLKHTPTGIVVDVALGCMPFEAEVIERARPAPDAAIGLLLPSPEDLIVLKAIANRPKDQEDIRNIVAVYPDLDRKRVKDWVRQYSELLETPGLWSEIEPLLNGE